MRLIYRLEPLFWLLFGAGGFAAALILPALLFGLTIAGPMGWLSDYAVSYHRVRGLVANPIGGPIVAAVASLVLWHGAHHTRHFLLDLGFARLHAPVAFGLYGLALLGTGASFAALAALL
ncbi:MAG: fumarate reductase subunit FrdD [Myxococcota bacterium]|nr:fumarate reductase subunit FrdD [Myxococcota bacterium]